MAYEALRLEISNGIAHVTLARPESLNALNSRMLQELADVFDALSEPDCDAHSILMTGSGRGFCSGADLSESGDGLESPDRDLGKLLDERYHPVLRAMDSHPLPIIAAVNGLAAGAGMSLALSADIVLAGRSAYFLQAFVNIGLVPDASSTFLLPRLIGRARAMEMMMLGEKISADKAEDWGLIYKAVDDSNLIAEATAIAQRLADGPTIALGLIRQLGRRSLENTFDDQLEMERTFQRDAGRTADFIEGVAAFFQKRAPNFKGR